MKKMLIYTSPSTTLTTVEMEGKICSGSSEVRNPDDATNGRIDNQGINSEFDGDFSGGSWGEE